MILRIRWEGSKGGGTHLLIRMWSFESVDSMWETEERIEGLDVTSICNLFSFSISSSRNHVVAIERRNDRDLRS